MDLGVDDNSQVFFHIILSQKISDLVCAENLQAIMGLPSAPTYLRK